MSSELPTVPTPAPAPASASTSARERARARLPRAIRIAISVLLAAAGALAVGPTASAIPLLYLAAVTPVLVEIDLTERRLPNRLVLPGYLVGATGMALHWFSTAELPLTAIVSGIGYFSLLLVAGLAGGMGMGDVKLGGVLGLSAGLVSAEVALASPLLAFTFGGLWSVALLARGRRRARIPFGPFLLAGYWLAVVLF